jgi:hypothetical protein
MGKEKIKITCRGKGVELLGGFVSSTSPLIYEFVKMHGIQI